MLDPQTLVQAAEVLMTLRRHSWRIATAESCTGGLIAAALTHVAGSSDVMERGFVTYSNEAKIAMLGVPMAMIGVHGAVSEAVAGARPTSPWPSQVSPGPAAAARPSRSDWCGSA